MMNILVLVPTYNKTVEDIKNLYVFLNIKTDAIFANQCGEDKVVKLPFNNKTIKIICSKTIGVSVNRNILLNFAEGDINIFVDDDCPLVDDYEDKLVEFYSKNHANSCIFNGVWATHENKLVHNKNTKKITHFNQISYAGGPGFSCTKEFAKTNKVRYNENIGTPNYICAGEDSLFYRDLVKSKADLYRSNVVLFKVAIDETNSSYFKGINEQYVTTRGFITKTIHPYLFFIYKYRHALRFKKQGSELSFRQIIKFLKKGAKLEKEQK